jgi:hypothetical protein
VRGVERELSYRVTAAGRGRGVSRLDPILSDLDDEALPFKPTAVEGSVSVEHRPAVAAFVRSGAFGERRGSAPGTAPKTGG